MSLIQGSSKRPKKIYDIAGIMNNNSASNLLRNTAQIKSLIKNVELLMEMLLSCLQVN